MEREIIGWHVPTPEARVRCSVMVGPDLPYTQCAELAYIATIEPLRDEPSNYRLVAYCRKHWDSWLLSHTCDQCGEAGTGVAWRDLPEEGPGEGLYSCDVCWERSVAVMKANGERE